MDELSDDLPREDDCCNCCHENFDVPPKIQACLGFVDTVFSEKSTYETDEEIQQTLSSALRCLRRYFDSED